MKSSQHSKEDCHQICKFEFSSRFIRVRVCIGVSKGSVNRLRLRCFFLLLFFFGIEANAAFN